MLARLAGFEPATHGLKVLSYLFVITARSFLSPKVNEPIKVQSPNMKLISKEISAEEACG
jgi:hypothetical protein